MSEHEEASLFERLRKGLQEGIAHSRGELTLKTTELPAPPPNADSQRVAAVRRKLNMSQTVFAATLNVSTKTVQSWEQGVRKPSDAALRMLQVIDEQPEVVRGIFAAREADRRKLRRRRPRVAP